MLKLAQMFTVKGGFVPSQEKCALKPLDTCVCFIDVAKIILDAIGASNCASTQTRLLLANQSISMPKIKIATSELIEWSAVRLFDKADLVPRRSPDCYSTY